MPNLFLKQAVGTEPSDAELSQVMVEMFVHENGPLLRFKRTKERMWVSRGAGCALSDKAINCCHELDPFVFEVAPCGICRE